MKTFCYNPEFLVFLVGLIYAQSKTYIGCFLIISVTAMRFLISILISSERYMLLYSKDAGTSYCDKVILKKHLTFNEENCCFNQTCTRVRYFLHNLCQSP